MPKQPKILELEVEQPEITPDYQIFNKENIQMFPSGRHIWRQQGPYVVCKNCPLHHAVWIGTEKIMTGENDQGEPILKTKKELGW